MTQRLTGSWLVDWSLVTIMGNTMPPRDPEDDDDDEDDDDEVAPDLGAAAQRLAVRQETAALRDFDPAYVADWSIASGTGGTKRWPASGLQTRTTIQKD